MTMRRRDTMSKGAGDADRSWRQDSSVKCECGRHWVSRKGKKCVECVRENKRKENDRIKGGQ